MSKRTAKQIREETFAELRADGRLDKPLYQKPDKKDKKGLCCYDKYGANLPKGFRRCIDCTVTAVAAEV